MQRRTLFLWKVRNIMCIDYYSGLGLFICKQLVTNMEGEIHCHSEEGKGTTFSGRILLEKAQITKESKPSDSDVDLSLLKVLVVEDNKVNMKLITKLLTEFGISMVTAENGVEAVSQYEA